MKIIIKAVDPNDVIKSALPFNSEDVYPLDNIWIAKLLKLLTGLPMIAKCQIQSVHRKMNDIDGNLHFNLGDTLIKGC